MGAINIMVTVLNSRAPGIHLHRIPPLCWAFLVTAVLWLNVSTSFCEGGDVALLQGGHPDCPPGADGSRALLWPPGYENEGQPVVFTARWDDPCLLRATERSTAQRGLHLTWIVVFQEGE
jgi:hypothetical protein